MECGNRSTAKQSHVTDGRRIQYTNTNYLPAIEIAWHAINVITESTQLVDTSTIASPDVGLNENQTLKYYK